MTLRTIVNGALSDASDVNQYKALYQGGNVYDVKNGYGATGDGTTDDTAAFTAALAAAASKGGRVWIPGSTAAYKITSQLTMASGVIMEGAHKSSATGLPTRLDFSSLTGATAAISLGGVSDVILRNFYLTGRSSGSGNEIEATGTNRRIGIDHVTINSSTTGSGIYLGASGYTIQSSIRNCTSVGAAYGFQIGAACTSITFETCYGNACTTAGYLIQGTYLALVGCAADSNTLYGYILQNANNVGLLGCGAEINGRTGFITQDSTGLSFLSCRAVTCNTLADVTVPSFLTINGVSDYISVISCRDTLPTAGTVNSVGTWSGTPGSSLTFMNNVFPLPYAAGVGGSRLQAGTMRTMLGATGSRPSGSSVGQGAQWFDTTLQMPIWSDGTNWRNSAGTVV